MPDCSMGPSFFNRLRLLVWYPIMVTGMVVAGLWTNLES